MGGFGSPIFKRCDMFKKWKKLVEEYERYLEALLKIDIARHEVAHGFAYHLMACKKFLDAQAPQPAERGDMGKAVSSATKLVDILLKLDIKLDGLILIATCGGILNESHLPAMNSDEQRKKFVEMIKCAGDMLSEKKESLNI